MSCVDSWVMLGTLKPFCCSRLPTEFSRPYCAVPLRTETVTVRGEIFGFLACRIVALVTGTSFRKSWKIVLSSGWVHSTLAVSVGTTSWRGELGRVKNVTWLAGRFRAPGARAHR